MGVSFFQAGDTANSFLDHANQALYFSKDKSQNQVTAC